MSLFTIFEITIACLAVVGFTVYAIKRSNFTKVNLTHDLDDNTSQVIKDVVSKVSNTAEHITDRVTNVAQPLSSGAGALLQSIADRISQKQVELERYKTESIALAQEVTRLQDRKINVTGMMSQIKLSLISVDQQYHSLEEILLETIEGGVVTAESNTSYLGLLIAKYKVQIGVDIDKLKFQISTHQNTIYVHGLRNLEVLGIAAYNVDTRLSEVRKRTKKGKIVGDQKTEILENDSRKSEYATKHREQLDREIQQNQSVEHLAEPNARFAIAFFQACLSSTGFKIEESIAPLETPISFGELCLEINRQVEQRIEQVNIKLVEIDHKNAAVKSSILAIARGEDQNNNLASS